MNNFPRITFGIIVLNGEPFTRYNLRALYPFAHEIIIVEGAAPAAANVATPDGHSLDGTLEVLQKFKAEEDPENKIQIITKTGFWTEKDEMSQAYAQRATGDYLWQIDVDEFYLPEDMEKIITMLRDDPAITAVSIHLITFWGGLDYLVDGWYARRQQGRPILGKWRTGLGFYHRIFKWGPGYKYTSHRPPTVVDEQGRDLRSLKWVQGYQLEDKGIVMYHYSLLFPIQVLSKSEYYGKAFPTMSGGVDWARDNYLELKYPFRVHNVYRYPSWLEYHKGESPPQIIAMWKDISNGDIQIERRHTDDIERLLLSKTYLTKRLFVIYADYVVRLYKFTRSRIKKFVLVLLKGLGVEYSQR